MNSRLTFVTAQQRFEEQGLLRDRGVARLAKPAEPNTPRRNGLRDVLPNAWPIAYAWWRSSRSRCSSEPAPSIEGAAALRAGVAMHARDGTSARSRSSRPLSEAVLSMQ